VWVGRVGSGRAAGASSTTLHSAALILTGATPNTGILTGIDSPLQADINYLTGTAHCFCFFNLQKGRSGVSNGEKQFGILIQASSTATPIHSWTSFNLLVVHWHRGASCV